MSLKVEQALHHAPAVWPTVDVVPKKDEPCIAIAGKVSARREESVHLAAAAMDVSDRKGKGTRISLTGTMTQVDLRQHYAACLLSTGYKIALARRKIDALAS